MPHVKTTTFIGCDEKQQGGYAVHAVRVCVTVCEGVRVACLHVLWCMLHVLVYVKHVAVLHTANKTSSHIPPVAQDTTTLPGLLYTCCNSNQLRARRVGVTQCCIHACHVYHVYHACHVHCRQQQYNSNGSSKMRVCTMSAARDQVHNAISTGHNM